MGNSFLKMAFKQNIPSSSAESEFSDNFPFHSVFVEDCGNGLCFDDHYLPEEIVLTILTYLPPKEILSATLVCKKWCNIIKSDAFWFELYSRKYKAKPKKLPWYVYYAYLATDYFDNNLIKNGNGQDGFKHWNIVLNYGDEFRIEDSPVGSYPLPDDVPEFNGKTSCFATSYYECNKYQEISFANNRLMQHILNEYKPQIYVSEWVTGRLDCGCVYTLWCKLYGDKSPEPPDPKRHRVVRVRRDTEDLSGPLHVETAELQVQQWEGKEWSKVELLVTDYPQDVQLIIFQHEGRDTQFWKGHYGSKMAGGVVKILFESIQP